MKSNYRQFHSAHAVCIASILMQLIPAVLFGQLLPLANKSGKVQIDQPTRIYRQLVADQPTLISGEKTKNAVQVPFYIQRVEKNKTPLLFGKDQIPAPPVQNSPNINDFKSGQASPIPVQSNSSPTLMGLVPGTPIGTPDNYIAFSGSVLTVAAPGFLANDIDLNGEALTATLIVDNVDHGTLFAFGDGSFNYTPAAGYIGTDVFKYTMRDASFNQSDPVTVTIEVMPSANRTPMGAPDSYLALKGTTLSIASPGFLANDIDQDGEMLTATLIVDDVDHGTLFAFGDGSFNYTPNPGYTGPDAFQYKMRDASFNQSDPVTVNINVIEGNRTPIGVPDHYTAIINTQLSIAAKGFLANDVDPDGEALTATLIVDDVDHGTLFAFGDGSFNYTPNPGYTGPDTFKYKMRDASFNPSDPVTVSIMVTGAGTLPVGTPDNYIAFSGSVLTVAAPGFLANDIDLNGEALTATLIVDNVDHGTLFAFGDGSFNYTPAAGYIGTDVFKYTMRDASFNQSDPVTVTIEVMPSANRTPMGAPDSYLALKGTTLSIASPGFLANDIDQDGEMLTATLIVDDVDHGTLFAFGDGSFNYTPNPGYTGPDAFQYKMRDASFNQSDPVTVNINVIEGNRTPIGVADHYTAIINTQLSIAAKGFLANDVDPDGEALTATLIVDDVNHGTLFAFGDGSFNYTPNPGYTGPDTFQYKMRDASFNQSDPVTVAIEVVSPNRPPVASAGSDQTIECEGAGMGTVSLDASGSSDPDNDVLTYTWYENGNVIAGPTNDAKLDVSLSLGVHTLQLKVEDDLGESDTDDLTITVADTKPPLVTAEFIPTGEPNTYMVACASSDLCDENLQTSSLILLPTLIDPEVTLQEKNSTKISIALKPEKVLVQSPDVINFWNAVSDAGGIKVEAGQLLKVQFNKGSYQYTFDEKWKLTGISGPMVTLKCTATDGSGNSATAEATAPTKGKATVPLIADNGTHGEFNANEGQLLQNFPNPFRNNTAIRFNLSETKSVQLIVYDNLGRKVTTLVNGILTKGIHQVNWNAGNQQPGNYYYTLNTNGVFETRKMVLIR